MFWMLLLFLEAQSVAILNYVRCEVFTAVTMKNSVFWDVASCRSYVNRYFGGTYRLHLQGRKIRELWTSVSRCLQYAAAAGSWLADFSTLKMEAILSSETSVHIRSTRRHISEDGILHTELCLLSKYRSLLRTSYITMSITVSFQRIWTLIGRQDDVSLSQCVKTVYMYWENRPSACLNFLKNI
jgi:hypothetical protein